MKNTIWLLTTTMCLVAACNYTAGDCYPRSGTDDIGAGGGVVITGGVGAFGDMPLREPQGISYPEAECNTVAQSPCNEKCLASYEAAGAQCGNIGDDGQRRACQDAAHAAYKSCVQGCQKSNDCLEHCKELCYQAWEKCRDDCPKGDKNCLAECTNALAKCNRECDKKCK